MAGLGTRCVPVPWSCLGALPAGGCGLVSENELPGHLDRCSLVVPVEGLEDVLILCLNLAPLSTRGCAARYPFSCAI